MNNFISVVFKKKKARHLVFLSLLFSVLLMGFNVELSYAQTSQPRSFPAPLPPYQHPRVFATAAELPQIKQNLTSDQYGAAMSPWLRNSVNGQVGSNGYLRRLADRDFNVNTVTEADINDFYMKFNEGSAYNLGVMALWGAIFEEGDAYYVADARETAIRAAVNHAILAEHTEARYQNDDYNGLSSDTEAAIKSHWGFRGRYAFNLGLIWRNGGTGLPLAYDMLYNEMTAAQQAQIRRGLVLGTAGWNMHGGDDNSALGMDGNAVSNHYGYQGDQMVMLAAIYGETGFSQASWDQGVHVMLNYIRVGFYPSGYPLEDSYGPNLGLREGSRGLIAMARQGVNEFKTRPDAMYNIGVAMAHDIESVPNGSLIGGESGGNYAFNRNSPAGENPFSIYPTFALAWKHIYPNDPAIDHLYRWRVGDDYKREIRWQSMVDYAYFGQDYLPTADPSLDLVAYYPQRGKLNVRNEVSDEAVQFVFDARPDASNPGHDKAGRGYFSLNGLGRRWVSHIDFRYVELSTESSTMHIDGKGQAYKTPSVKVVSEPIDDGLVVSMAADLEYAYDWQWSEPWTWSATDNPKPSASDWEHETTDPRDFYVSGRAPEWVGDTLWDDPNSGYKGMWMWRRPNQPVEKAYRSVAYVRSDSPFVIIADDIKKDGSSHRYESYMQLPFDLDQMTVNGNDAILWANGDDRRLLVRVLDANKSNNNPISFNNETYTTSVAEMDARRLIIGLDAVDPQLNVMLWPHKAGDALPQTTWNSGKTELTVDNVKLRVDRSNGYALFSRPPVLEMEAENATLSGSFQIANDGNASGGKYIHVPNGTGGGGTAEFVFTVPQAGFYAIEGDVYGLNANDDSFFVRVNGAKYIWDVARSTPYNSDYVNNRGETSQVQLYLTAGQHTVMVDRREDGTRLDKLRLVSVTPTPVLELEAENAELSGVFQIDDDSNASGGKYIHVPNGTEGNGAADFAFTVTQAGSYAIEGDVYAANGGDDSFSVRVNGEPSRAYTWDVAWNTAYNSDYVNDRGLTSKVEVYLEAGYHTVTVYKREDGARLDKLRLLPTSPPPTTQPTSCQEISDTRGTHHNVTWGSATPEEREWWIANGCTTQPSIALSCQGISDTRGTHHNVTWGSATAEERAWWLANGCTTQPS